MRRLLVLAAAAAVLAPTSRAGACSMCRCGDPTFNALGTDVFVAGRFRLSVDWDRFEKESAADAGEGEGSARDREIESRYTATLAYSFGESVTAVVRVPWSHRALTTTGPGGEGATVRAEGLSDPEATLLIRVWSSPFAAGMGKRSWVSLVAGVKTGWGRNDVAAGGERLDEHVQPGTGSTDVFGGVSSGHLLDLSSSLFASAQLRRTGANDHGYRYGDVVLVNVAYERKLAGAVDGVVELNYRHAKRDVVDASGTVDPNTGGGILYVTPRVIVDLGRGLVARVSVQVPLAQALYGDQRERTVAGAGLTFLF